VRLRWQQLPNETRRQRRGGGGNGGGVVDVPD
jgi:hypothetical protein